MRHSTATYRKAPFFLQLRSLDSQSEELWTFSFEPELLTLQRPDNTTVLTLHRQEAARYLRFEYDLLRGRTMSLVVIEGLKHYAFRCNRSQVSKLLAWLPHLSESERTRQVRYSGIAVTLFGVFHLLLPQSLLWTWGIALLVVGLVGLAWPRRWTYLLNAVSLFLVGLWDLFAGTPGTLLPWNVPPEDRLVPIVVGTIVLLWAVQQASMLGPNHHLRIARGIRDQHASFLPTRSRLVRRIGWWNLGAAILFGVYTAIMLATLPIRLKSMAAPPLLGSLNPAWHDIILFGVLSLFAAICAIRFIPRQAPAYFEAKVAAQVLITAAVFSVWGLFFNFAFPPSRFDGLFAANLVLFTRASVWISLVVCVLGFNRWFMRIVDREVEEQRD